MGLNTDMEYGKELLETVTSASGFKTKRTVMEYMNGATEIVMKESGSIVYDTGKAVTLSLMEMFT